MDFSSHRVLSSLLMDEMFIGETNWEAAGCQPRRLFHSMVVRTKKQGACNLFVESTA
jgi:hypothetical protein